MLEWLKRPLDPMVNSVLHKFNMNWSLLQSIKGKLNRPEQAGIVTKAARSQVNAAITSGQYGEILDTKLLDRSSVSWLQRIVL